LIDVEPPTPVAVANREEWSAKTVHDPFPSHGWQEVCRKVFRKKSTDQPRYHHRPIHERLQLPTGLGKWAGVAISCVFVKFQWLANPNVSFSIGTSVARITWLAATTNAIWYASKKPSYRRSMTPLWPAPLVKSLGTTTKCYRRQGREEGCCWPAPKAPTQCRRCW
jgi:hypothetical protein